MVLSCFPRGGLKWTSSGNTANQVVWNGVTKRMTKGFRRFGVTVTCSSRKTFTSNLWMNPKWMRWTP